MALLNAGFGASDARATSASVGAATAPEATTGNEADAITSHGPAPVPLAFGVRGAAQVRTGIRGSVTISGTFRGSYDPSTHRITGDFALTPTRARVVVLGLVPVIAETDWSYAEPVSGEWRDGVMQLRIAARIRHPNLYAFGSVRVAGGPNCATTRPSIIELRSSASSPVANPLHGGTLGTTGRGFTISPLAGCGPMDALLSAVAAGDGNQATLTLTSLAGS